MDLNSTPYDPIENQNSDDCMFKSLLTQIEMEITSLEDKTLELLVNPYAQEPDHSYTLQKQIQCQVPDKSISEWVWKDDAQDQFQQIPSVEEMTPEPFQLKRVQSMRIQQENKLSQFLRTNYFINEEQDEQYIYHVKETMNLSPRKKKHIDKSDKNEKEKQRHRSKGYQNYFTTWSDKKPK